MTNQITMGPLQTANQQAALYNYNRQQNQPTGTIKQWNEKDLDKYTHNQTEMIPEIVLTNFDGGVFKYETSVCGINTTYLLELDGDEYHLFRSCEWGLDDITRTTVLRLDELKDALIAICDDILESIDLFCLSL